MSIGDFLESLSQAILVGIMLVGRLGVQPALDTRQRGVQWIGGAVDGGHRWSNKQDTHRDNCQA